MTRSLPDDTRGIIDPVQMMRYVDFARYPAGEELDGIVAWFWAVDWRLPAAKVHNQQVLNHPAGNISVGTIDDEGVPLDPAEGRLYGVMTSISTRRLTSAGWTIAARASVGGLGVFLTAPAKSIVDRRLSLDAGVPGLNGHNVTKDVAAASTNEARVALLRNRLSEVISRRDPALVAEAREVNAAAKLAESDPTVRRTEQLAKLAGVSVRTLQRRFDYHVGVSPAWVIRRWRIIEAVEAARTPAATDDRWNGWGTVAADLGYADQAHLTRDFRRHLGVSPAAYLAQTTDSVTAPRRSGTVLPA